MKTCYTCKKEKPFTEFHKHKYTKDGRQSYCKLCWNKRKCKMYAQTDICLTQENLYKQKELDRKQMFNSAKTRAKKYNIPFDIELSDIYIPVHCPVFGVELKKVKRGKGKDFSPSLDRIIPERGYVKNNIVVVSFKANRMKSNGTIEDLYKLYIFYSKIKCCV